MRPPVILRVFKEKKLVEVRQFDQDQIVIGHNAEVHLDLDGAAVSPIHCLIELRDSGYYVCDLGSKVGTLKNGQPILDDLITSGDELTVGPFMISFSIGVPKPRGAPLPDSKGVPQQEPKGAQLSGTAGKGEPTLHEKTQITEVTHSLDDLTVPITAIVSDEKRSQASPPKIKSELQSFGATSKPNFFKKKKPKGEKTFAPPSLHKDLREYLRPGKGTLIEVIISWKERILETHQIRRKGVVTVGSGESVDIKIPTSALGKSWPLIKINSNVVVQASPDSTCQFITSQGVRSIEQMGTKVTQTGTQTTLRLDQSEIIAIKLADSPIEIFVRFAPQGPPVPMLPPFLLNTSELTGIVMIFILVALLALWVIATKPIPAADNPDDNQRIAEVIFEKPKFKPPPAPPPPPPPKEEPKPPPAKPPEPTKIVVSNKTQDPTKKGNPAISSHNVQVPKKAAEVAPIPNSQNKPKIHTSTKQGGAFKQSDTAGANAESAKPKDLSKIGLFSAFGGGGHRSTLDKAYSGAGDVIGNADKSTGSAGFNEDRPGDDLGSKFKDVGAGGKGTQTEGISGVGTKGRSNGRSSYGSINGFGDKGSVRIEAGGAEADFVGSIDREAVRRTVRSGKSEIEGCYERELSKLPKGSHLEGKIVITWTIVEKGVAKDVKVKSSTLGNTNVENCIRDRLASWQFPPPPSGTIAEVSYPFVLRPIDR